MKLQICQIWRTWNANCSQFLGKNISATQNNYIVCLFWLQTKLCWKRTTALTLKSLKRTIQVLLYTRLWCSVLLKDAVKCCIAHGGDKACVSVWMAVQEGFLVWVELLLLLCKLRSDRKWGGSPAPGMLLSQYGRRRNHLVTPRCNYSLTMDTHTWKLPVYSLISWPLHWSGAVKCFAQRHVSSGDCSLYLLVTSLFL